jgi:hypothetical protein
MERIYKPAWPTADDAVGHSGIVDHSGYVCWMAVHFGGHRRPKHRREDFASSRQRVGTLIHNGNCSQPCPIGLLAIPLVESPFQGLAMAQVGCSTLLPARFAAAMVAAVLLPAITAAANAKWCPAPWPSTKSLTENNLSRVSHAHPKARLDNGCGLWQFYAGCVDNLSHERCCQNGPRSVTRPGSPLLDLPLKITRR